MEYKNKVFHRAFNTYNISKNVISNMVSKNDENVKYNLEYMIKYAVNQWYLLGYANLIFSSKVYRKIK